MNEPSNEVVRARISAMVEDLELMVMAVDYEYSQPDDREAFDILARIERQARSSVTASVTARDAIARREVLVGGMGRVERCKVY